MRSRSVTGNALAQAHTAAVISRADVGSIRIKMLDRIKMRADQIRALCAPIVSAEMKAVRRDRGYVPGRFGVAAAGWRLWLWTAPPGGLPRYLTAPVQPAAWG